MQAGWKALYQFMIKRFTYLLIALSALSCLHADITSIYTFPGGNNGDIQFNDNGVFGGIPQSSFTTGGGSSQYYYQLLDVSTAGISVNYQPCYNGVQWVVVPVGTSCNFSIASFSDANSLTQEIGTGVWKSTGNLTFSATYSNGPPIGSTITFSGWSALPLTSPFTSVNSVASVNYPAVAATVVFTLSSQKGSSTDTETITHTFVNRRFWGVTTVTSGFSESDVEALTSELSNSVSKTFSVTAGSSEYILWASPTRLGTVNFTVGGFSGGFMPPETVSVTNASGYTENYYVYRSVNSNLGATTVVVAAD